jgi:peptidoglycan/LPS O-acetylase OafA/YrhL
VSANTGRMRGLDGLRGLSILLVLASHATSASYPSAWLVKTWGSTGVALFFAISGYIITTLLTRERAREGRIGLGAFYYRRAFRILPPLWVFLLGTALLRPDTSTTQFAKVALFVSNYSATGLWWLDHSWSLSVEEQFYLLWPFAMWFLSLTGSTRAALILVLGAPLLRVGGHLLGIPGEMGAAFHTIVDAIMIGCLVALVRDRTPNHLLLRVLRNSYVALFAAIFMLALSPLLWRQFHAAYMVPLGFSLRSVAAASIVLWATSDDAKGMVARALSSAPAVHLGVVSYSLYLWQQPFFDYSVRGTWIGSTPVALTGALLCAELSHRLVERPALRLRDYFGTRRVAALHQ